MPQHTLFSKRFLEKFKNNLISLYQNNLSIRCLIFSLVHNKKNNCTNQSIANHVSR